MPNGIGSRLDDCLMHKGSLSVVCGFLKVIDLQVARNCLDCIVEFCMVAELRRWNQGRSEKEWTSE